jgi:CRISPR-associated Csx2 family protein
MSTLLSFLGKGDRTKGYRTATYRFAPDFARKVPYFGLALQEYLKPDHLILAGTDSSMWDVFLSDQNLANDDMLLELMEAVQEAKVSQTMLQSYEQRLSDKLGVRVTCLLIPLARNEQEQVAILQSLADAIPTGEELVLDVTHGFRHLPMLALVAARYLSHVRNIKVNNLYYGALDMTQNDETPVLELGSLLNMLDWIEALAVYDNSGNYGVFGSLLQADGMAPAKAALLEQAAFFERTSNPVKAGEKLRSVFDDIQSHSGALGRLFAEALGKRINWFRRNNRADKEQALAEAYFSHQDYLRATTYFYESTVSRAAINAKKDPNSYEQRQEAFEAIKTDDHKKLKNLRNSMAHGIRGHSKQISTTLGNEQTLRTDLQALFKKLKT